MIPISVCVIAKNEEKNIEKCLAPLVPYNFEIILVDTGSTDRTKEIARKYTDQIYDFEWVNDFSAARNFSLKIPAVSVCCFVTVTTIATVCRYLIRTA